MAATALRDKLHDYLRFANDKKIKAIYTMVEDELNNVYDMWKDKDFIAEMEKRSADLKSGKVKGNTWEEVKQKAKQSLNRKKK